MEPDEWPFSDHVYVVTTASPADVADWAAELGPEAPGDAWWYGVPPPHIDVQPPAGLVTLWWD